MTARRLLLTAVLAGAGAPALAQSPFLRQADMRTRTPEAVMSGRKDWGLDLSFGGNFNRGNVDADSLSGGFSTFKALPGATVYLSGSILYSTFGNRRIFNQGALTARVDRGLPWKNWKIFAFNTNAYNEFLRVNHRATTGAGPWYDLALGPTTHGLSLAVAHEHERFKFGSSKDRGRLSFRSLSRVPLAETAELSADFFWIPSLHDSRDQRLYGEVSLQTKIWKDNLGLRLAWIAEHDSRPQPRVRKDDTLWLTSLTLRFGK